MVDVLLQHWLFWACWLAAAVGTVVYIWKEGRRG